MNKGFKVAPYSLELLSFNGVIGPLYIISDNNMGSFERVIITK